MSGKVKLLIIFCLLIVWERDVFAFSGSPWSLNSVGGQCGASEVVVVKFDSDPGGQALDISKYGLTNATITGATRQDSTTILLTTSGLTAGVTHTLSVPGDSRTVSFQGLMGHYFDQRSGVGGTKVSQPTGLFTGSEFLRLDNQVNFSWAGSTPAVFPSTIGNDERFSIRWSGYIQPSQAGNYEFRLYSDDGVRLDLNGIEIVNDWNLHGPRYSSSSAVQVLNSGQQYAVQMEHFEHTGQAYAQLEWRRNGGSWQNIPSANLSTCAIAPSVATPVIELRMDENSWNGSSNEVGDLSGNGLHGISKNGAITNGLAPALIGDPGTCRYGEFNGSNQYIEIADNPLLDMGSAFTVSVWIKIDSLPSSGLKTILSKDENYEFHVNSSGKIYWWWQTTAPNATRSFNSTATVSPGVWTHITIRHDNTSQTIFLNGSPSGSASFTGTPKSNADPLQIGADQNLSGRYFNGDIDEVRIFDSALSNAQIADLANETHACGTANPSCSASFPAGISSYNNGTVDFNYNARIINNPGTVLSAAAVTTNGGSSQLSCGTAHCQALPGSVVGMNSGSFPNTSSFSEALSVGFSGTGTIGSTTNEYQSITSGSQSTLNFSSSYTTYYIDTLSVGFQGRVILRPGDYWINQLTLNSQVKFSVLGGGTARIFVNQALSIPSQTLFNATAVNDFSSVSVSSLLLYGYSSISLGNQATLAGAVYSRSTINMTSPSYIKGAVTGDDISLGASAEVTYDSAGINGIDFGSICDGGGSCSLGSFAITQPTYGLACPSARAGIKIQAMCVDGTTVKTDYAGTIDLSSDENSQSDFFLASSGGSVVSNVALTGTENGKVDVYLFHKNENHDLKVIADDSAASVSSTAISGTYFGTSGFYIDAADQPSNFICGESTQFKIRAIGQDPLGGGACSMLNGFTGNKALKAWSNINIHPSNNVADSGLERLTLNGSLIPDAEPVSNNITTNFNNGEATFTVEYADVGQVLDINIRHDDAPYDDSISTFVPLNGSTNTIVVYPKSVQVNADSGDAACTVPYGECTQFVSAGVDFDITAKAVCSDDISTAHNYIGEVELVALKVAPTTGIAGQLFVDAINIIESDLGSVARNDQTMSEVGVLQIKTTPKLDYFGVLIAPYISSDIGRFYPASFDISFTDATFGKSCDSRFTYMDQPFLFLTPPEVTIKAFNLAGDLTENYEGEFWKLGSNLEEDSNCSAIGAIAGFCYSNQAPGTATLDWPNSVQSYGDISDIGGQVTLTLHNGISDEFTYQRPPAGDLVAPFDADIMLNIDLKDLDLVTGTGVLEHIGFFGESDPVGGDQNLTNDKFLRYGRWVLENAFGPETSTLKIPMSAQYYDDTTFVTNTDDNCSVYDEVNMEIVSTLGVSASGSGKASSGEAPLNKQITLDAPGSGNTGTADVCLTVEDWLKFDWNGDGLGLTQACNISGSPRAQNDNPTATTTFGRYRGHDRIIYWREVSN